MPVYPSLPGVQQATLDGGLRVTAAPTAKPTIIVGTSPKGPANQVVLVDDPAVYAQLFGLTGTLGQSMYEALIHSDNVALFRMGTQAATLAGIGADATHPGINITLGQAELDANTIYQIWYANGSLYLWLNGELVYANDPLNAAAADTGDSLINGTATDGLSLCVQTGAAFIPAAHVYAVGDIVQPTTYNGMSFRCSIGGAAGATEPIWVATLGSPTVSGAATFIAIQPSEPDVTNALTLAQAIALVSSGPAFPVPVFTPAVDGMSMNACQTYEALDAVLDLLSIQNVQQIWCPNVQADTPNVAYYVSTAVTSLTDPTNPTAFHNPLTNPGALGWLQTTEDVYGDKTYLWAHLSGATFVSVADRLAQGYHEVSFQYALARFAAVQQEVLGGCLVFIGTNGPAFYNNTTLNRFDPMSVKKWVGVLPSYDVNGNPTTMGRGLLGLPFEVGCNATYLNPMCTDYHTGYRLPGLFATEGDTNEQDGIPDIDANNNKIDVGANVHVVGDWQLISTKYAYQYVGCLVGIVAGYAATLDQTLAITYKQIQGVTQVWWPNFGMMNALSTANINACRGDETTATLLHDNTSACSTSDWTQLYRMNLKFLVSQVAFSTGKAFLGTAAINGLQMTSLQTALDSNGSVLAKRGYITAVQFSPTTNAADARIGKISCGIKFQAPDQARQLFTTIGITR